MDNPLPVSSAVAPSLFSFTRFVFTSPYQLHISPTSTQVDAEIHYEPLLHSPLPDAMQPEPAILVSSDDSPHLSSVHFPAPPAITSAKLRRSSRMSLTHSSSEDSPHLSSVHFPAPPAITSAKLRRSSRMSLTHSSSEDSRERGEFDPKKKKQMRTSGEEVENAVGNSSRVPPRVRRSSSLPVQAHNSNSESSSDDDSPLVPLVLLSQGKTFVARDTDSARISLKAMFKGSHVHGHVVCNNSR
jgi:hypothetical protein